MIKAMGAGFNLGNTFDLAQHNTDPATLRPIIDLYYRTGFRHVRIPITWMEGFSGNTLAGSQGQINLTHPRLLQAISVVDYALSLGMYVIINTHHEHWLKSHYDGSDAYDATFARLWTQIAEIFKSRSSKLIFEVLNEPERAFGDYNGGASPIDPVAQGFTREINEVGYRAIRATGGANSTRLVLVMPNAQGNSSLIDELYPTKESLPGAGADPFVGLSVHTYDPWDFCGQTGSNRAWPGSTSIRAAIQAVAAHGQKIGTPIHFGEFGVGRATNQTERNTEIVREYYRTTAQTVLSYGMAPTVWDDRGWFGLVEADGAGSYRFLYNIAPSMIAP